MEGHIFKMTELIMALIQLAFGIGFIVIGIVFIFANKLCSEKIEAVYTPEKNGLCAFVFKKKDKEIKAYPINLYPTVNKEPLKKDEKYEVYICKAFPKLLIISKEIPKLQYVIAASAIMMGLVFIAYCILGNFI